MRANTKKIITTLLLPLCAILCFAPKGLAGSEPEDKSQYQPVLILENISADQAVTGGDFYISFVIKNITKNPAFNVALDFKVAGTSSLAPFSLKGGEPPKLEKIDGQETRSITVGFQVAPDAQAKDYKIEVLLTCQNVFFQPGCSTSADVVVSVGTGILKPRMAVTGVAFRPEAPDPAEPFDVYVTVQNMARGEATSVAVALDGLDNFEVQDLTNKKYINRLPGLGIATVNWSVKAKSGRSGNNAKLKFTIDYQGNQRDEQEETINLPLPAPKGGGGVTPWLIIGKYTLSAQKILAGNVVTLSLYIENTNPKPVRNIKISLGVIAVEAQNQGQAAGSAPLSTGGTVFSPVDSSNSFFIDEIPGKTAVVKSIDLLVDPNAAARTYTVPVKIQYEDVLGKAYSSDEMVNIPVTQQCKLQVVSVEVPTTGFVGQKIPVNAEFVNVGKAVLSNFTVYLEGDFNKENGTYFVGNLSIGASDFFQAAILPKNPGKLSGKVVFVYTDLNNKEVKEERPFEIDVKPMQPGPPGSMEPGGTINKGELVKGMPGGSGSVPGARPGLVARLKDNWLPSLLTVVIVAETIALIRIRKKKHESAELIDE
ncbi:MAG TPA: hypothetical protein GXX40_04365 [Firmicutes bacterium]|nr:hypothetical protein [Bacillota bacterium]